jgi:hypothetical protein
LAILKTWDEQRRNEKDIILKLHTGQGKNRGIISRRHPALIPN